MNAFKEKNQGDMGKAVTLGVLLEYTDEFLIPTMSDLMDEKILGVKSDLKSDMASMEHRLKSYIDDKLADQLSEIFKRWDKTHEKEKDFKRKVIELFKKHNIGNGEDWAFLEGFVAGS